jgi:hypothetical protein
MSSAIEILKQAKESIELGRTNNLIFNKKIPKAIDEALLALEQKEKDKEKINFLKSLIEKTFDVGVFKGIKYITGNQPNSYLGKCKKNYLEREAIKLEKSLLALEKQESDRILFLTLNKENAEFRKEKAKLKEWLEKEIDTSIRHGEITPREIILKEVLKELGGKQNEFCGCAL